MEHAGEPSWDVESSIRLAKELPGLGVDVLDVSSSGNNPNQKIRRGKDYQTEIAGRIRAAVRAEGLDLAIAAVGFITEAETSRALVQGSGRSTGAAGAGAQDGTVEVEDENGHVAKAEFVLAARQFLRDPQWVLKVARELNVDVRWPSQYERAKPKPKPLL